METKNIGEQIGELPVKSFEFSSESKSENVIVKRDPNSPWGGREVRNGEDAFQTLRAVISGDFSSDGVIYDHKKFQALLDVMVKDYGVEFNDGILELVNEEKGWEVESVDAKLIALSVLPDGKYFAKIHVNVEFKKFTSEEDLATEAAEWKASLREEK
jgi:hypothetical protein